MYIYIQVYVCAQMYKPIKHYLLVPMERIRCFSHEESKIPWANTSI